MAHGGELLSLPLRRPLLRICVGEHEVLHEELSGRLALLKNVCLPQFEHLVNLLKQSRQIELDTNENLPIKHLKVLNGHISIPDHLILFLLFSALFIVFTLFKCRGFYVCGEPAHFGLQFGIGLVESLVNVVGKFLEDFHLLADLHQLFLVQLELVKFVLCCPSARWNAHASVVALNEDELDEDISLLVLHDLKPTVSDHGSQRRLVDFCDHSLLDKLIACDDDTRPEINFLVCWQGFMESFAEIQLLELVE